MTPYPTDTDATPPQPYCPDCHVGLPDLNRLLTTATWDPVTHRWTRPGNHTTTTEGDMR